MLGGRVARERWQRQLSHHRRHRDDRAATRAQCRQRGTDHVDRAGERDVDGAIEVLRFDLEEVPEDDRACVGDHGVKTAQQFERPFDRRLGREAIGDIHRNRVRRRPARASESRRLLQRATRHEPTTPGPRLRARSAQPQPGPPRCWHRSARSAFPSTQPYRPYEPAQETAHFSRVLAHVDQDDGTGIHALLERALCGPIRDEWPHRHRGDRPEPPSHDLRTTGASRREEPGLREVRLSRGDGDRAPEAAVADARATPADLGQRPIAAVLEEPGRRAY